MIDLRGGVLAVTICLLIALAANQPSKPLPQNAPICLQPVWEKTGRIVAGHWIPCVNLDRYEKA